VNLIHRGSKKLIGTREEMTKEGMDIRARGGMTQKRRMRRNIKRKGWILE